MPKGSPVHRSARLVITEGQTLNRVGRRGKYLGSHLFSRAVQARTIRDRHTGHQLVVVDDGADKGLYEFT